MALHEIKGSDIGPQNPISVFSPTAPGFIAVNKKYKNKPAHPNIIDWNFSIEHGTLFRLKPVITSGINCSGHFL